MAGELANLDRVQRQKVSEAVLRAVRVSFEEDQARIGRPRSIRVTNDEVKRRTNICLKIFAILRGDLDWGLQRAIDHFSRYLRLELDGDSWEPDERQLWVPSDGA